MEDVTKIIKHWGNWKKKSNMYFEVEWADGSPSQWLSWKELRANETLHNYLRENKMEKLIPSEFK